MSKLTVAVVVAYAIILAGGTILGVMFVKILTAPVHIDTTHKTVQAVCEYTRTTEVSEQPCIEAMIASGTEYICTENSPRLTNICWVEDNKEIGKDW